MARTQGTSARPQRLIAGAATVLVAATAAIALGRVFEGNPPTLRLLAGAVASGVIAALLERRNLVLATIVSVAGLAIAISLLVFLDTTWFGVPTMETLRAAIEAAGRVGEQARVQVAPSPPLAPLVLAGLAGAWAAVFAAHSLAFRAGSPLLALLPPVALVGFADSVLEDVVRPIFGLLFLVAAAALLFADGLRRVQGWGPVWTAPGRAARLEVAASRGARRVGAAAVTVAAVAPILIPGFGSRGVIDFSTSDDRVRIDPLVSVQESLTRDEVAPVFEVQADVGRYWRMVALPNFDGRGFSPDPNPGTIPVVSNSELATSTPPAQPAEETTQVTFTTTSELALPWLPLPYPPRSTDASLDGMRWDPQGGSIFLEDGIGSGVTYSAVADVVQPTPGELRDQQFTPTSDLLRYTAVPDALSPVIAARAEEWSQGADSVYDQIIAIQDVFTKTGDFTYNEDVPATSRDDALVVFLDQTKEGFCQQFAVAMAAMLRTLGIPARLAVGFTPGQVKGSGEGFTVTTENAHVWVEVLFPSFGWIPFEPTPNRQNVEAYPYLDPDAPQPCDPDGSPCAGSQDPNQAAGGQDTAANSAAIREGIPERGIPRPVRGAGGGIVSGVANAAPDPGVFTPGNALLAAVSIGAIGLGLVPPARGLRRRRRLRRAQHAPRSSILATYDVFADRAAELGHGRLPGQTLEEYRRAVTISGAEADGSLGQLTRLATDAAYALREPGRSDAEEATRASHEVMRAMRRQAGWSQRVTGPYRRR